MNQKNKKIILWIIILIVIAIIGCFFYVRKMPEISPAPSVLPSASLEYRNDQFKFTFQLPLSWKNYSIIVDKWTGTPIDTIDNSSIEGPKILIRHPEWTESAPRQDIPIMIFDMEQWALVQSEKLSLGAAPIGPSELGRNAKYVFALPARYNYAFPLGFEEVDKILQGKPLHGFN